MKRRFGIILNDGLTIASRTFRFLGYAQSSLKEHSVWFMMDFVDDQGHTVTPSSIIRRIVGNFKKLAYDPKLIYCPARIALAFSSTDSSVTAEAEEVFIERDTMDSTQKWTFTDGIGTISPELARAIWKELKAKGRRSHRGLAYPRAYQIRFMDCKGVLSVNYKLSGRAICIRESMIKFDAPNSREVEIAQASDKPHQFYLNLPLIMLLEDLGVRYEVFKELQDAAVAEAQRSAQSLPQAADLLEKYGLGASYRLPSVMLSLAKLGLDNLLWDQFYEQIMDFSVNYILRDLKHRSRIPVKDAWNLVGVADVHGCLKESEVFVHVAPREGGSRYLKGPIMISRSPVSHPGDVQVATAQAIGRPPLGSPFEKESRRN